MSLDAPLPTNPDASLGDILANAPLGSAQIEPAGSDLLANLRQFCDSIPPSQPRLRRMAELLLELLDEEEAVQQYEGEYGRGGTAQLKRLRREIRAWSEDRNRATG